MSIPESAVEAARKAVRAHLSISEHPSWLVAVEAAAPFIAEQTLDRMADKLEQYGSAASEGGKVAEARTYSVAAALTREQAEWTINQEDQP